MTSLKNRRISRKDRKARKIRNFLLLSSAAILSGIVFSLAVSSCWHLVSSLDIFTIENINIHGAEVVDERDFLSGSSITIGAHILKVNLTEESRRLEQNPWIYRAVVNRRLPDTIDITLFERTAVALIEIEEYYLMDTRGNIFKKADSSELVLPVVNGINRDLLEEKPDEYFKAVNSAISLINEVNESQVFANSKFKIEAGHPLGLTLVCDEKEIRAFLGWDSYDRKVVFLGKIIRDLQDKGQTAKKINLSSDQKAYVTL